ncbi:MAG TPA: acyltransferase [Cyclobacteriaceae bacterium]|jgi:peptidoglycan/LPS O-acetylase OafA/YrhL|nr:acyltransferase [Cyclobacteriaceae bacterium]
MSIKASGEIFKNGHIPSLDGFRMISICLVIFSHLILRSQNPYLLNLQFNLGQFGILGVRIFFIISGFLITFLLLKEKAKTGTVNLRYFYIRRILRIFPVFFLYLIALHTLNHFLNLNIPLSNFLGAALFIQNFGIWGDNWYLAHTWSLAVEEQFYIAWPIIFLFVPVATLKRKRVLCFVLMLGIFMRSFHYKFPDIADYFLAEFIMYADFLFAGCYIACLQFYNRQTVVDFINNISPKLVYISILAICIFTLFEFHPIYDKVFIPLSGTVILICVSFLLIYFTVREKSPGFRLLNLPVVIFIGQLSYSLYLWQQLFFGNTGLWLNEAPENIVMIFIVALFSYYVVEKPILKIREKFRPTQ